MTQHAGRRPRRRPDPAPVAGGPTCPSPGCAGRRSTGRVADAGLSPGRHRRGRGREGAGPVRGRDDARAVPGRRARRDRQAAAAGAHGGLGRRRDRARRGQPGPGGRAPPGAGGGVREAVGVQRHVGAVDHAAVQHAAAGRGGRVLRAAHPRLHPPQRRARSTSARWSRSRTGATAAATRTRTCSSPTSRWSRCGLPHAVGPGPVRRDLPVLGRRVRGGDRRPGGGRGDRAAGQPVAWIRATAMRTEPTMFAGKDHVNPRAGRRRRRGAVGAGRHHRPAGADRRRRDLRAVLLVRADVAGEPRLRGAGPGLAAHRGGRDARSAARCRSTRPAGCSAPTRSGPPGCCGSRRPRCRSWARPAITRWPGRGPRSATPTAAARSTSRCGWWPPPPRDQPCS